MKNKSRNLILLCLSILCLGAFIMVACNPATVAGKYYNVENDSSYIEIKDATDTSAKIDIVNFSAPSFSIYNVTQYDLTVELIEKDDKIYTFKGSVNGKQILGTLNIKKKIIIVDDIMYKK